MSDAVNNEEQGLHLTDDQVKYLANSALMTREALAQQLEGGHIVDVNKECGYKDDPTIDDYVALYEREGVANRVIRLLPEETWQVDPYVYETEDATETAWEKLLAELVDTHNLWAKLEALDVASGIGQFGGMIIGLNDGQKLATPVKGFDTDGKVLDASAAVEQREILYLRVYSQKYLKVIELETNQSNLRYGLPKMYELEVQTIEVEGETTAKAPDDNKVKIHWSRVIHVTDGCINSEAYSAPRAEPNYNRLMDVRKTLGGAAEMLWKAGFPGFAIETHPGEDTTVDIEAIKEQMESYFKSLRRFLAFRNVTTKALETKLADPSNHFEMQVKALAIQLGCPYRLLLGTEEGRLAGDQDSNAWHRRITRRQGKHAGPNIIRVTIDRFIALGVLPEVEKFYSNWEDLFTPSAKDKAEVSLALVKTMALYITSGVDALIPPLEFLTVIMKMTLDEAEKILEAAKEQMDDEEEGILDSEIEDEELEDEEEGSEAQTGKASGSKQKDKEAADKEEKEAKQKAKKKKDK